MKIVRVLITGSRGLVGRNLLDIISKSDEFEILSPSHQELDLCDKDMVKNYLVIHKPDIIIHAAGYVGGIQANINNSLQFLIKNLDMGRNLVYTAYELGIRNFINLGSSCMYPRNIDRALTEDMVLKGELEPTNEGYALAKCTVAKICEYIDTSYDDYHYKTLIPCNLYGKWDKFDLDKAHLVPSIINKIYHAKKSGLDSVIVWGSGNVRREFLYAGDLATIIIKCIPIIEKLPSFMNVGVGEDYTVNEYYEKIAEALDYDGCFIHDYNKPEGMNRKLVDVTVQKRLGLYYVTSLEEGITLTLKYYIEKMKDREAI